MSLSSRASAAAQPWALDELSVPDIFAFSTEREHPVGSTLHRADTELAPMIDLAALEAAAFARGCAEGERAARAAGELQIATAVRALHDAVASVEVHAERWVANAEENVAALAVLVAQHVIQAEVNADPTFMRDLVQRALSHFPIDQAVTVRLHPEDAATCTAMSGAALTDAAGRLQDVRWIADATITRGGCLLEGRERIIDGRVDAALERAYRAMGEVQA
jgi:flagellar biosynthesis/type III secretory pathway protein FliH